MSLAYKHGAYVQEKATALVTPSLAESALPVVVGTAPVHRLADVSQAPVNDPRLIFNMPAFEAAFGKPSNGDNQEDFPLWQMASAYFSRYRTAPLVAVNVFDPVQHVDENDAPDVSKVTKDDVIGGVGHSGGRTGLALVDEVFPRFRLTPGVLMAPKWSGDPSVAKALETACNAVSGLFRATGIIEIPDAVTRYADAPAWLNDNNLCDQDGNTCAMFGDFLFADRLEPGSIHLAGCIGARDVDTGGVPYWSPSNFQIEAEGMYHHGEKIHLTPDEAAYLNANGIVTGLNWIGGLRCWGDQTTAYPGVTDVKDASIPIRRMFTWIGNSLILTHWQHVSAPILRRQIETVQDSVNYWLNGLVGRGYILGGRATFEGADNPATDLMSGICRWHVYINPPQAARELTFILEYDPAYLQTLFDSTEA